MTSTTTSTGTTTVISGDFVYAVNPGTDTLSGYAVGSGSLTAVSGSPYALASTAAPTSVCISGTNAFLYVGGIGGIYGYSIASSGVLTALSGGAQIGASPISQLACSPDGNWVIGLDNSLQQIDEYQINTSTGLLTPETATVLKFASGNNFTNSMIAFSPLETYVFADLGASGISAYTFNASTGALTTQYYLTPSNSQISFNALAVNSTDTTLYVAETGGVLAYGLTNNSSGVSAALSYTTAVAAGTDPASIVFTRNGDFLYVGNLGSKAQGAPGTITGYSFLSGVPTPLTPASVSSAGYVQSLARDNSGNYLLTGLGGVQADLALYSFSNSTSGTLNTTPVTAQTSSVNTGSGLYIATTH